MLRINLLPPQLRRTGVSAVKNTVSIVLMEALLAAMCLCGYGWWRHGVLSEQLQATQQELALLQPVEERRLHWATSEARVADKARLLIDSHKDSYSIYRLALALGKAAPDNICLTKVVVGQDHQVVVQGYALDYSILRKFTAQLAAAAALNQLDVQSCERVENDPLWQGYLAFVIKSNCKG